MHEWIMEGLDIGSSELVDLWKSARQIWESILFSVVREAFFIPIPRIVFNIRI